MDFILPLTKPGFSFSGTQRLEVDLANKGLRIMGYFNYDSFPSASNTQRLVQTSKQIAGYPAQSWFLYYGVIPNQASTANIDIIIGIRGNQWWSAKIIHQLGLPEDITSDSTGYDDIQSYMKSRYDSYMDTSPKGSDNPFMVGMNYVDFPLSYGGHTYDTLVVQTSPLAVSALYFNVYGDIGSTYNRVTRGIYYNNDTATKADVANINSRVDTVISNNKSLFVSR